PSSAASTTGPVQQTAPYSQSAVAAAGSASSSPLNKQSGTPFFVRVQYESRAFTKIGDSKEVWNKDGHDGVQSRRAAMANETPNPHASEDTRAAAAPAKKAWFSVGYKDAFSQWWEAVPPAAAEAKVFSFLPFNQPGPATEVGHPHSIKTSPSDPHGQRKATSTMVELSGNDRILNEFNITRLGEEVKEDFVMLHGYGAGLGFFYKNYDGLSSLPNWRLWALDLLGYGRSSRPPYKIHSKDPVAKVREAEDWFIDALEEWRIKRGLDRFTLLGHSLGGYLAVCYALKYPGHLKKLILASPVGIPLDPYATSTEPLKSDPPSDSTPQTFA